MNERVRRPILHLKLGSAPSAESSGPGSSEDVRPARQPAEPVAPAYTWKCRPCGTSFTPPPSGPDDEAVRCPACNARLGRAGDFRLDPPPLDKLRARAVKIVPPPVPAPAPPTIKPRRSAAPVVTVRVLKKVR